MSFFCRIHRIRLSFAIDSRRSRRDARRAAHEAAARTLEALKSDVTEAL